MTSDPAKTGAKDLNRHFSQEDLPVANKHIGKMLNIVSLQGNPHQHYIEILLLSCLDGNNQKDG